MFLLDTPRIYSSLYLYMHNILAILLITSFSTLVFAIPANAQQRSTVKCYEATPEKFLNKKVTIYVTGLWDVKPHNENLSDPYRIYEVWTSSQDGQERDSAWVLVPSDKAEAFIKKHSQKNNEKPRPEICTFREPTEEEKKSARTRYIFDLSK